MTTTVISETAANTVEMDEVTTQLKTIIGQLDTLRLDIIMLNQEN